jgi:ATP-dependent Lhr-like helicase
MALASDGVPVEEAWSLLESEPDFRGVRRSEFDRLLEWMCHDKSLLLVSGRLVIGPKAERQFGRRNFRELYAVFSSPQSYTVQSSAGV